MHLPYDVAALLAVLVVFTIWLHYSKPRYVPKPVPFGDHILIQPVEQDNLVGGLQAPESNKARPSIGKVIMIGPGKVTEFGKRLPMEVKAGELVSFPTFAGHEISNPLDLPDGTYLMLRQEELYLNHGFKNSPEDNS